MSDDPIDLSALRKPKKTAACPICGRAPALEFRPFCSKRCADVDLNRWLGEVYRVPVEDTADDDEGR
ncbi:DNA gyrase inhibitor YacG [Niveispirillum lacus]|uniref:DNA gyrase inhibitor YacG n=1 Tax=Niveispirillum lacus TaxID=1981099 RepID=A0A255YX19_9PROT|nr:DNA gyrase inhibitor YacG [Niveispirillum lacus]OYQ33719.1 DNA gyrase inhibitor YacG [Niveispirillum lacus]